MLTVTGTSIWILTSSLLLLQFSLWLLGFLTDETARGRKMIERVDGEISRIRRARALIAQYRDRHQVPDLDPRFTDPFTPRYYAFTRMLRDRASADIIVTCLLVTMGVLASYFALL